MTGDSLIFNAYLPEKINCIKIKGIAYQDSIINLLIKRGTPAKKSVIINKDSKGKGYHKFDFEWGQILKKYSELTPGGIKRRFRKVAELALVQYYINVAKLDFLLESTNVFFKVTDISGTKYALKIFQEESSTIEDNLTEMYFLNQVGGRAGL